MANFTPRNGQTYPKNILTYKTFQTYAWNHLAPETAGNCTWFAFGETSRIVQECEDDESYNIQYESGNEFMTRTPNAMNWISNATAKGAWETEGETSGSDPRESSQYGTQVSIDDGDILCYWSTDGFGHVEIVESISNGTVHCSGSKAALQQAAVLYYERDVAYSEFTIGKQHTFSAEGITWSNDWFQGVIKNPHVSSSPEPEPSTEDIIIYAKITGGKGKNVKLIL